MGPVVSRVTLALTLALATGVQVACSTNSQDPAGSSNALPSTSDSDGVAGSGPSMASVSPTPALTSTTATDQTTTTTTTTGYAAPNVSAAGDDAMSPLGSGGAGDTASSSATSNPAAGGADTSAAATNAGSGGVASDAGAGAAEMSAGAITTGAGDPDQADAGGESQNPTPSRPLDVSAPAARHEHRFRARDADSEVSYNDNDQIALFDNRAATLMGKLVLTFGGAGETKGNLTGGGEFCAQRGFHVLAVAAFQAYNIVDSGPDFFGDARRSVFEGVMHTRGDAFANIELTPADGVARRTQKALEYLHAMNPDEDWGYYLQPDGSVRWSDVIFTGVSHGASNSARFAFLVEASRVVSIAGPRDNLCTRVDLNDCGGEVATWLSETPQTPIDRFFAITGVADDQHTQHLFTMDKLGYVGEPTALDGAQPPYGDSHRLVSSGGHDDFCAQQNYQATCNYVFGVPAENHAGTGP